MANTPPSGRWSLIEQFAGSVREHDLPHSDAPLTIGRAPGCDVSLDSWSVSRKHAVVYAQGHQRLLEDLGSLNGTYVNATRLDRGPVEIRTGDELRFGDCTARLRFTPFAVGCASQVTPSQLQERLREEGLRCVRHERSIAAVALEAHMRMPEQHELVASVVLAQLRDIDAAAVRAGGRLDILLAECGKQGALIAAQRIHRSLGARDIPSRLGVAVYPGEAPGVHNLLQTAELAMGQISSGVTTTTRSERILTIGSDRLVIAHPMTTRLFARVERIASAATPVLVTGETGVGKEIMARAIHALGERSARALVTLRCAAVPDDELARLLFDAKDNALARARGGTLLVDEIGDMPALLQARLLRDARHPRPNDVRIIATATLNPHDGHARERGGRIAYFQSKAVALPVPPLRNRRQEIPFLVREFATTAGARHDKLPMTVSSAAMAVLTAHEWTGNVQELRNAVEGAVLLCEGRRLDIAHFGLSPDVAPPTPVPHTDGDVTSVCRRPG